MNDERGVRIESDTLGEMEVPADALYGAQTARAVDNFPISGWPLPAEFIHAHARIKAAFAKANAEMERIPGELAAAIVDAAQRIIDGEVDEQFPIDVFQTGSGTSTNMNVNEVIAHLANKALDGDPAGNSPVHPNDHVNSGQSSNDTIPASIRISAALAWKDQLSPAVDGLVAELRRLAGEHEATVTLGRTHLMDAVPTTYGRVFRQWAVRLERAQGQARQTAKALTVLPLGGTALGTGLGAHPDAVKRAVGHLAETTDVAFTVDETPAAGIAAQEPPLSHADALAGLGRVLLAIANDLRLRGSGPFGGLAELKLTAVQPGSSIMPGKVNPVIPEAVAQVALQVEGFAAACRASACLHQLDLSHANPLVAFNLLTMTKLLANACTVLVDKCLSELGIDGDRCRRYAFSSPAMATALARRLGYEKAAEIAKASEKTGEPVAEMALRMEVLPEDELKELLDLDTIAKIEG